MMMNSQTTRLELKNRYKNLDSNNRKINFTAEPKATYSINNDKDCIMPMIKMLYTVYQQVKNF